MINGNEPAMPIFNGEGYTSLIGAIATAPNNPAATGLTIRQQFAMAAMQGMCANPEFIRVMSKHVNPDEQAEFLAVAATEQADALITALNNK